MDLRPGDRFERYVIEALLGQGGMGKVYRARDERLRRTVALKIMRFEGALEPHHAEAAAALLLREARAAAGLDHANTIAIHDVGEFEGTPFIAMELVDGQSLRAIVGDASVSVETRVRYLVDVARGLAAAHARGIIHRDIKPENVIVRRDGVVKVLDFGIAQMVRGPADEALPALSEVTAGYTFETWSRKSGLMGTPRFMAPEQLRGEELDDRADQFSWGVMAYELLTGKSPWPEAGAVSLSLVLSIVDAKPVDEKPLLRVCPRSVAQVVLRALAKDRASRFASMSEIVDALGGSGELAPRDSNARGAAQDSLRDSMPSPAGPPSGGASLRVPPSSLGLVALTIVAIVVAFVEGPTPTEARASADPPPASATVAATFAIHPEEPRRITFSNGCEEFPSFTPDSSVVVYAAEQGDDEHVVAQRLADGTVRSLTQGHGWDLAPVISPDGTLVAYLRSTESELATYVVDFEGRLEPRRIAVGGTRPSFSPDSKSVWAGRKSHPTRYDLGTGAATRTLDSPANAANPLLRELPDGHVVALYPATSDARVAGIASFDPAGAMTWLTNVAVEEVLAVTRDGRFVLGSQTTRANNAELFAVPVDGGELVPVTSTDVRPSNGFDFSADGSKVAWSTCRSTSQIGRFDEKGRFDAIRNGEWQETSVAPIHGTHSIAVVSWRGGPPSLWILDAGGQEPPRKVGLGDGSSINANLDVSPDGKVAVVERATGGIALVRLADGATTPLTNVPGDEHPLFSGDGREVVFTRRDGHMSQVHAVRGDGGEDRVLLEPHTGDAAPSPVDQRIAYIAGDDPTHRVPMIVDLATNRKRPLSAKLGPGRYMTTAFSEDGRRIAVVEGESVMVEVDAASGAVLRRADAGTELVALRYVGDELWAAGSGFHGNVWLADISTGAPQP